jgi:hypothetical protein
MATTSRLLLLRGAPGWVIGRLINAGANFYLRRQNLSPREPVGSSVVAGWRSDLLRDRDQHDLWTLSGYASRLAGSGAGASPRMIVAMRCAGRGFFLFENPDKIKGMSYKCQ